MEDVYTFLSNNYVIVPENVSVRKTKHGYGLFSNVFIPQNTIIYRTNFYKVTDDDTVYNLHLRQYNGDISFKVNKTHTVQNGCVRDLYTYGGFINHSCDPNTKAGDENTCEYETVAIKDINADDELTCNYLVFDYDCNGHSFACNCMSKNCVGFVAGFKNLTSEQQLGLLSEADHSIQNLYAIDNNIVILEDLECPDSVEITKKNGMMSLISTRSFKVGDVVFINKMSLFDLHTRVGVRVCNEFVHLYDDVHFTQTGTNKFCYKFDSFGNHSCDPNCSQIYTSDDSYKLVALCDISIGDEITCDYKALVPQCETSFVCMCNKPNCRKIIYN
jgi:hypothetical protein